MATSRSQHSHAGAGARADPARPYQGRPRPGGRRRADAAGDRRLCRPRSGQRSGDHPLPAQSAALAGRPAAVHLRHRRSACRRPQYGPGPRAPGGRCRQRAPMRSDRAAGRLLRHPPFHHRARVAAAMGGRARAPGRAARRPFHLRQSRLVVRHRRRAQGLGACAHPGDAERGGAASASRAAASGSPASAISSRTGSAPASSSASTICRARLPASPPTIR